MSDPVALSFEDFWEWLGGHINCIISAGTPEAVLYDHDDYHWHLDREGEDVLLVQVVRGKHLVGEIIIARGEVTHVEGKPRNEEEYLFECFMRGEEGAIPSYFFTLSHGYEVEEPVQERRWVH
jgi:hypothetical protein